MNILRRWGIGIALGLINMVAYLQWKHQHPAGIWKSLYDMNSLSAPSNWLSNSDTKRQKVVILMTQMRSGSSFTGRIFAGTNGSMYLYEPLVTFGRDCTTLVEYKMNFLTQLLNCNFSNIQKNYDVGFRASHVYRPRCADVGFCFNKPELLRGYAATCRRVLNDGPPNGEFNRKSAKCGYPLKEDILHQQCLDAKIVFAKITRVCTLDQLQEVFNYLESAGKDAYVIHLVRDPRSTTYSRLTAFKEKSPTNHKEICDRIRRNLAILDPNFQDKAPKLVSEGKYMRVRFEDLSMDAIGWAQKLFRFIGIDLPTEVEKKIRETLQRDKDIIEELKQGEKSKAQLQRDQSEYYGTTKDSKEVLRKWRRDIPLDMAMRVQRDCGDIMQSLGYIAFEDEVELRDVSKPFFW